MARDKRGQLLEPDAEDVLDELAAEESEGSIAGPTNRNEAGDTKRAVAKAAGLMGASKKIDPDLKLDDAGRPRSGSKAGLHGFNEVPPEHGVSDLRRTLANDEIAADTTTTARKAPAPRAARTDAGSNDAAGTSATRRGPHRT
jgi:hypothetical protein